jgi:FkbM family methyltransferase
LLALRIAEGYLVVPSVDMAQVIHLGQGRLPEPGTVALMKRLLPVGGTLVDVGANLGLFTLVGGRTVGPLGRVIAIEPTRETADILRQTVRLNGLANFVEVHEVAAGVSTGEAELHIGPTSSFNSLISLEGERGTQIVRMASLDEIVGRAQVDFVKIDVEGWELAVLDGMSGLLARNPQLVIVLEYGPAHLMRAGITRDEWMSRLRAIGRRVYAVDEESGRLYPFRPGDNNVNVVLGTDLDRLVPDLMA